MRMLVVELPIFYSTFSIYPQVSEFGDTKRQIRAEVVNFPDRGYSFRPYRTVWNRRTSVICETPSKFIDEHPRVFAPPPPPKYEWDLFNSSANATYLFSKVKLPWLSAEKVCSDEGGSLAKVENEEEKEQLGRYMADIAEREKSVTFFDLKR